MRPVDRFAHRLDERGLLVGRHGDQLTARCSAHVDYNASLSVGVGEADRALVHCHASCRTADVLDALGLQWSDLFADDAGKPWSNAGLRRTGAQLERDGRVRLGGTRYLPDAPNGQRKTLAAKGATRDLWPDPAGVEGEILFVVEGEPDAVTGATLGLPTVAVPGAAKWQAEWAARLAEGRERVVVVADADEPGRKAAQRIAAAVGEHCPDVRLLDLAPEREDGSDLSDFAAAARDDGERAHARTVLVRAAGYAPRVGCQVPDPLGGWHRGTPEGFGSTASIPGVPTAGTLAPPAGSGPKLRVLDVERMLTTEPPPVPWVAAPLLAEGCVTLLAGREGQGKSMLALALAATLGHGASVAGIDCRACRVLYVDAENGEREAHRRVRGLGVKPGTLVYVEADGFSLRQHWDELAALADSHEPRVVVLDSLRSLAPGLDENDSAQAEAALRPIARLAQSRGLAVLLLHHAGKAGVEYRGSTAIGAAVELGYALGRHPDDPRGRTRRRIFCWKSRPAPEPEPMWLELEARDGAILLGEADPFEPTAGRREDTADALLTALNGQPTTWAQWARDAGLDPKHGTARRARDKLHEQALVVQDEHGQWRHADENREAAA